MTKSKKKQAKTPSAKTVYSSNTRLSNQVKKEALAYYVQSLVDVKLSSPKKQNCIDNHHYDKVHSKIQSIGMHWLTPSALKSCVIRAYKAQCFDIQPPSSTATASSSASVASHIEPTSKPPGRPVNTSFKDLKEKEGIPQ